jgi:uncharacterized NAD(P)/FAD-binding protein YdhS/predicted metal-dependent enzyme (double-stranded beta helix superfamily)
MSTQTESLLRLTERLDQLGPEPSLVELSQTLADARLTFDDISAYVRPAENCYHRALVAARPHYELLVMTWRPGQASPPHDHAGSICAMQVLQGEGAEDLYRVAADGYVDLEYETPLACGEITAGQDAGIHVIRNASKTGELLVTVHIYAPPLKDFRRFIRRPDTQAAAPAPQEAPLSLVVIGGGFSGCAVAAQALRRASQGAPVRVAVVERRGSLGEGIAYGTQERFHLLNVPAGRMSLWPDRPDDFVGWANRRHGAATPTDFLPRTWYGEYARETLLATAREQAPYGQLSVVFDEVRRVARHPQGGWLVHLGRGPSLRASAVVLAVGHRPPSDPLRSKWQGPRQRFLADAWRPFAMNAIGPDDPVVILGSGLTAIDAVLSLSSQPRQAPITLLSRRGLTPKPHAATPVPAADLSDLVARLLESPGGLRIRTLSRTIRQAIRERAAAGGDWRSVVDGLRPHTAKLWQAASLAEHRRFLRHLRPFWEAHRHRMAPEIAARFQAFCNARLVRVVSGRVDRVEAAADSVTLELEPRRGEPARSLTAAWVVNCTGPSPANQAASNPAIGSLLIDGWLRSDELGLGIETTAEGRAIDHDGRASPDLFVIGTLRKPAVWESTAVPELREQAAQVAECALAARQKQPAMPLFELPLPGLTGQTLHMP